VKIGLLELAVAAWSGWAMVVAVEKPGWLRRAGVRHAQRIRQSHIDLILMGLLLTAVGLAVQPLPTWIAVAIVPSALLQPLMFVPLAFNAQIQQVFAYKALNGALFAAMTAGWIGIVVEVVPR
jgi:hydroxylaminobenzene mutase